MEGKSYRLQKVGGEIRVEMTAGGGGAQSDEADGDIGGKMWHLEQSVLVDFCFCKVTKKYVEHLGSDTARRGERGGCWSAPQGTSWRCLIPLGGEEG